MADYNNFSDYLSKEEFERFFSCNEVYSSSRICDKEDSSKRYERMSKHYFKNK